MAKMLKFIDLPQAYPDKENAKLRKQKFKEIYEGYIKNKAVDAKSEP